MNIDESIKQCVKNLARNRPKHPVSADLSGGEMFTATYNFENRNFECSVKRGHMTVRSEYHPDKCERCSNPATVYTTTEIGEYLSLCGDNVCTSSYLILENSG